MVEDFGEMDTPNPDESGELANSLGKGVVVLRHDSIVVSHTILSRGNTIENEWSLGQIEDMSAQKNLDALDESSASSYVCKMKP